MFFDELNAENSLFSGVFLPSSKDLFVGLLIFLFGRDLDIISADGSSVGKVFPSFEKRSHSLFENTLFKSFERLCVGFPVSEKLCEDVGVESSC